MDWSQVWRLRILLKRPILRPSVGIGPEMKADFPVLFSRSKRWMKSAFVSSDYCSLKIIQPLHDKLLQYVVEHPFTVNMQSNVTLNKPLASPGIYVFYQKHT